MSRPEEEQRAIRLVWGFLHALTDPQKTKRIPSEIRRAAGSLLRHYPGPARTEQIFADARKGGTP